MMGQTPADLHENRKLMPDLHETCVWMSSAHETSNSCAQRVLPGEGDARYFPPPGWKTHSPSNGGRWVNSSNGT